MVIFGDKAVEDFQKVLDLVQVRLLAGAGMFSSSFNLFNEGERFMDSYCLP